RAGRYSVRVSRGGSHGATKSADVGPGNKATVSLKLEAGVTVNGVVRETSGAPVAGARIWLTSPTSGWAGGQVVTQTDSAGGFRLRDIPTGASIGAIAEGWTPSGLLDLDLVGVVDGEALVELELSLAGGAAAVSVEGTGGEPVPGALVAITRGTAPYRRRLNLTSAESWTPRTKRTNAAGQLRFDGLGEGVHEIHVRVEGVPRWSGDIEVLSSSDAELTVRLQGTCTVMGRVFGSDGMPAQGAIVRVVPPEPAMLTDGPGGSPFAQPWTKAGNDGRFTLFGLTPGRVKVSATLEDSPASATTTLSLTSGETATWEPVLDEGGRILGSLLYADRSAVNTTYVVATAIGSREETSVHVSRGKFRFEGLTEEAYDLRVESLEPTLVNIEARLEGVRPTRGATDEPIEWILEAEAPAPRRHYVVRAILRDEGVRAPEGGSLRMVLQDDASGVTYLGRADKERSPQGDSSAWLVNMQRPADVTPIFLHGGRVIAWGESVELDGAGDVDLGTIRSVPGATIQLDLVRPSALRDEPVTIELEVAGLSTKETVDFGAASQVQLDRLEPGPAILRLSGPQCVPITRELVLESGKQASLTLELALR
ncbi:MAG: carboxypeptidase-like regulatory domain-containing protein, partial [Planctomycetota bacterium]